MRDVLRDTLFILMELCVTLNVMKRLWKILGKGEYIIFRVHKIYLGVT